MPATTPSRTAVAPAPPTSKKMGERLVLASLWALAAFAAVAWMGFKSHGRVASDVSSAGGSLVGSLRGGGLDGTYVCSEGALPTRVTIRDGVGAMDLGVLSTSGMRVERHGDTVSMSGGQAYDAQGRPIDARTRASLAGGDDVDLFTVRDDGQSLALDLGDGRSAKFVRQP